EEGVTRAAAAIVADLAAAGVRVRLDDRVDAGFGRRSIDWELKGVPVRVEVGPRDCWEGQGPAPPRHTRAKEQVALGEVVSAVTTLLATVGPELEAEARAFRDGRIRSVDSVDD